MPMPPTCPKCDADFPESLERFGANFICKVCGQIQRIEDPALEIADSLPERAPAERVVDDEEISEELPPIDQLLARGWEIFRERMGLCIGAFIFASIMNYAVQTPMRVWQTQLVNGEVPADRLAVTTVGLALAAVGQALFSTWINIGYSRMMLRLVRGEPTELGDLFRGGRYFWRAVLCTILLTVAIAAGLILCVIPGILAAVIYWPFMYVLIDRDLPGVDALWKASEITAGWRAQLLALFAICFLITLFGLMALLVGVFVAAPYTFVVYALAYDNISGRRHSRRPDEVEDDNPEE